MKDLITIEQTNGRETVSARQLHAALEVTTRFNDWMPRRIESYGFIADVDFYSELSKTQESGRPCVEYHLSVPMAKELATVENNEKGREVRRYLIKVEEAWNTPELVFARALQAASQVIEANRKRISQLEPKAAFFDQVADSKTALQMRDAAAALNINGWGRNKIFQFLRDQGVFDDRNIPYRQYQDLGYFRVIEQTWTDPAGETHVSLKTLVYQKGLDYIRRRIMKLESVTA
jgi:anti-repressor protein